jgi:redox-sensitive bicupin YhaK (pirin superfamily)
MSNVDSRPAEVVCAAGPSAGMEILAPRTVPLGGPRAMPVLRTLPQRRRSLLGAWCAADHYGPLDVVRSGGMDVPPHPHTGLQTVSWLFSGEIEHRDSAGVRALIRPGELNVMTAGAGICHSEVSTPTSTTVEGFQLWVALPARDRNTARAFEHYVPEPIRSPGATIRVFMGKLPAVGPRSPVHAFTPLLGAQIDVAPHVRISVDIDSAFEHGVLVGEGVIEVVGTVLSRGEMVYQGPRRMTVAFSNPGPGVARVLLLGGVPFAEELVMWWNFVGRNHQDIVTYRDLWERHDARFGDVQGYEGSVSRLPAPPLPNVTLRPRRLGVANHEHPSIDR